VNFVEKVSFEGESFFGSDFEGESTQINK